MAALLAALPALAADDKPAELPGPDLRKPYICGVAGGTCRNIGMLPPKLPPKTAPPNSEPQKEIKQ